MVPAVIGTLEEAGVRACGYQRVVIVVVLLKPTHLTQHHSSTRSQETLVKNLLHMWSSLCVRPAPYRFPNQPNMDFFGLEVQDQQVIRKATPLKYSMTAPADKHFLGL